jgi:hypothetical protein
MGTTATVAAKLAGADGRTIYICGLTARDGIVAARATTPVTGTRDGIIFPNTSRATPPNPLDRHLSKQHRIAPAEACAAAVSICRRNCAEHSDAATMTDCYLR